jgi:hypothetical protein
MDSGRVNICNIREAKRRAHFQGFLGNIFSLLCFANIATDLWALVLVIPCSVMHNGITQA